MTPSVRSVCRSPSITRWRASQPIVAFRKLLLKSVTNFLMMGLFPLLGCAVHDLHLRRVDPWLVGRGSLDRPRRHGSRVHSDRLLLHQGQRLPAPEADARRVSPDWTSSRATTSRRSTGRWRSRVPAHSFSGAAGQRNGGTELTSNLCIQMFDSLAEKLQATLADVRGHGTLTEADVNGRDAGDPPGAAGGGRQLPGRQELHQMPSRSARSAPT